jgi:hypothetical protein
MADTSKTATYNVKIDASSPTIDPARASLDKLRDSVARGQDAVKKMSGSLKLLRGDSDKVREAKTHLKNLIQIERDQISRASLAILDHGTTYDKLAGKVKKAAQAKSGLLGQVKTLLPAFLTLAGAIGGIKFVFGGADTARDMALVREAALGSAEGAEALGSQLDDLARRVATPKAELNKLGVELYRSLSTTRVTGQGIVDTFNAVAQAAAGGGEEAGRGIREIIEQSKRVGRLQIGSPLDFFQRTGVDYSTLVDSVAKQFHLTTIAAKNALFSGRVEVNKGAQAIRDAVEKTFAGINARKMISFTGLIVKLKDNLVGLASGFQKSFEGTLQRLGKLVEMLDVTTVTGASLKRLFSDFGTFVGKAFEIALPFVQGFFYGLIIAAKTIELNFLRVKNKLREVFGPDLFKGIDLMTTGVHAAEVAVVALTAASIAFVAVQLANPFVAAATAITLLIDQILKLKAEMQGIDTKIIGGGILGGADFGAEEFGGVGIAPANAGGGKVMKPAPGEAFASVAPGEHIVPAGAELSSGRGLGRGKLELNLTINVQGGGSGEEIRRELSNPSFLQAITGAIEDVLSGTGIPTQQPNPGVA